MYADYERLVLEYYQWKKGQNALSSQLLHPTPARIKRECVRLCGGKLQSKDEKVIRDFCEVWDNTKTCLQNIVRCDVDKFRPLLKFLKRDTESTDPKNIQLLAWLIDFPYRPFVLGIVYPSITEIQAGVEASESAPTIAIDVKTTDTEDQGDTEQTDASTAAKGNIESTENVVKDGQLNIEKGRKKMRFRKVAMVGVLLAVTGTSGYLWRNLPLPGNGGCMYWAKDHFQPIPCNQKVPNTLVVALDTVRVKSFQKITRPDTITNRAKGSVWYSKINNEIEFFTTGGEHPVVIGRRLKPITDHIIDKYIHPEMTSNQ